MKKYYVQVENTCNGMIETVEVSKDVYDVLQGTDRDSFEDVQQSSKDKRYQRHERIASLLKNPNSTCDGFKEFREHAERKEADEEMVADKERKQNLIVEAIASLTEDQQELIVALFFMGMNESDYGKSVGVSQQVINYRKKVAIECMKKFVAICEKIL